MLRALSIALALVIPGSIAAANNDDGFVWIDANTRIKVLKPVGAAAGGATTPEKAPKKAEKKEKPAK